MGWLKVPGLGLLCCDPGCGTFKFTDMTVTVDGGSPVAIADHYSAAFYWEPIPVFGDPTTKCCMIRSAFMSLRELTPEINMPGYPAVFGRGFPAPYVRIRRERDAEPRGYYADVYINQPPLWGGLVEPDATYPVGGGCDEISTFSLTVEDLEIEVGGVPVSYTFTVSLTVGCPGGDCFCPGFHRTPNDDVYSVGNPDGAGAVYGWFFPTVVDIGFTIPCSGTHFATSLYWNVEENAWMTIGHWSDGSVLRVVNVSGVSYTARVYIKLTCAGHLTIDVYLIEWSGSTTDDPLPPESGDLFCSMETDIVLDGPDGCDFTFEADCSACEEPTTGSGGGENPDFSARCYFLSAFAVNTDGLGDGLFGSVTVTLTQVGTSSIWTGTGSISIVYTGFTATGTIDVVFDESDGHITVVINLGGLGGGDYTLIDSDPDLLLYQYWAYPGRHITDGPGSTTADVPISWVGPCLA